MDQAKLQIIGGIVCIVGCYLVDKFEQYYVNKRLPTLSQKDQERYLKVEKELVEMGKYNIPFYKGKLIGENANKHTFYLFGMGID